MQGPAGQRYLNLFLSTAIADLGFVPDWKRVPYWCNSMFLQACRTANRLPTTQEAEADLYQQKEHASSPLSNACSRMHSCLCLLGAVSFARLGHAAQGVKRIMMSCGCVIGGMHHSNLKYECLCRRPRKRHLHSCCQRARCCWQGKPASAATQSAPLFAVCTVNFTFHALLLIRIYGEFQTEPLSNIAWQSQCQCYDSG